MRLPHEEDDDEGGVHDGAQCHQRLPTDELHQRAEQQRTAGVNHPEADHDVADLVNSQGARDVGLQEKSKRIRFRPLLTLPHFSAVNPRN